MPPLCFQSFYGSTLYILLYLLFTGISCQIVFEFLRNRVTLLSSYPEHLTCRFLINAYWMNEWVGSQTLFIHSVQFSCSVVSNSLWPRGLQLTRPPCPSPTPRVFSNSCPLSQWCHPTISSSIIPFSSHLQSFPASGSFQMSQFFTSGGHTLVSWI